LASILAGNYTRENLIELENVANTLAKKNYKKKEIKALPTGRVDEIGSVARTISAISTNLKQQIALLAKQRDQFGNVLDDIGQGIIVFDANGVVTYANDESHNILNVETLTNLNLEQIPSKPIQLLFDQAGKKGKFAMEFEIDSGNETRWILAQMNRSKSTGEKILVLHD
jgi:two-component system phosphate regulon sensor histidine kinase PhoR